MNRIRFLLLFVSLLFTALLANGQFVDSTAYNFVGGAIVAAGQSTDGSLKLSGTYSDHGDKYGMDMKANSEIKIAVQGRCTVRFLGSKYSGLNLTGVSQSGGVSLGTQSTKVTNDLTDYFDFVYDGGVDTLVFTTTTGTGNDLYLPQIEVIPQQPGANNIFTSATKDIIYYFDFRDGSILPFTSTSVNYEIDSGLISLIPGSSNAYGFHDTQHGANFKPGNSITIQVAGNSFIKVGGSIYSKGTITASSSTGTFDVATQNATTSNNYSTDSSSIDFIYKGSAGTVTLGGFTNTVYIPIIRIIPIRYTQKLGTIMFNGDTISVTSGTTVSDSATVTVNAGGTVTSATAEMASISTDLGGNKLSSFTPTFSGDISSVSTSGDTLLIAYDSISLPFNYKIIVTDNSNTKTVPNGKIDVWDFGAEQLDTAIYNNELTVDTINSWYDSTITPGSSGNTFPASFTAGVLSWVGRTDKDRLRTTDTLLTRYDESLSNSAPYTGRLYVNSSAATSVYLSLNLRADDEVTIEAFAQNSPGLLTFEYAPDPSYQTDQKTLDNSGVAEYKFVAKKTGAYHIYDAVDKPSYCRIYVQNATYDTISGTIDTTAATGIPANYGINLTNQAGKTWNAAISGNTYSVIVPAGYSYDLNLSNANGYVISNGNTLDVTDTTSVYNFVIKQVELHTVSGSITGLDAASLANLALTFSPDPVAHKVYVPGPVVNTADSTYTVQLEPGCNYTITAQGVNDYYIPDSIVSIMHRDTTITLAFVAKPVYHINFNVTGLTAAAQNHLQLTFTNLNESGYVYTDSVDNVSLRDGVYAISYSGIDDYPVKLRLTSNLKVSGDTTSKDLVFNPVTDWTFDDKSVSGSSYEGLLFTGSVGSQVSKGHLTAKDGATIKVPVNPGDKITVTYYYSADFFIDTTEYTTNSGSTSQLEYAEYSYPGDTAGYVTITVGPSASTTYMPEIAIGGIIPYQPEIWVGADTTYKTINDALDAVAKMNRTSDQRVTVMIEPGNYEEMLVINSPNITLKNAAADPTIGLTNKGVDITTGAVRITSYYGHGYNYYSMGTDQEWNADALRVNKENGYTNVTNTNTDWNATVIVNANGFRADHIIFENSFNQYISKKESEDIVVLQPNEALNQRPTDYGDVIVQQRTGYRERACALAFANNVDKGYLYKCRIVGRQDILYGGTGARIAFNRCVLMGGVDYIFGAMTAVFYKNDLVMNSSDDGNDASYIAAAQQSSGRGYLMYKCEVKSPIPNIETASQYLSRPGFFGRPWLANTSEVVFYNTTIDTSGAPGYVGKSLIDPLGWNNSLGGDSKYMYEYGTTEWSGVDNSGNRAVWSTELTKPILLDSTAITTYNFTKGTDGWDPFPVETDTLSLSTNSFDTVSNTGGTMNFDINSNVAWTVSNDQKWVTFSGSDYSYDSTSGYGFDTTNIGLIIAPNTDTVSRTATVGIYGDGLGYKTITIIQAGVPVHHNNPGNGIKEVSNNSFTIYPNPARSNIVVKRDQSGPGQLVIMNSLGQVVYQKTLESESTIISLPSVQPGLYIVAIDGKKEKLIIR